MARNLAVGGVARPAVRGVTCVACLAFVMLLGLAFWAGALWLGQAMLSALPQ